MIVCTSHPEQDPVPPHHSWWKEGRYPWNISIFLRISPRTSGLFVGQSSLPAEWKAAPGGQAHNANDRSHEPGLFGVFQRKPIINLTAWLRPTLVSGAGLLARYHVLWERLNIYLAKRLAGRCNENWQNILYQADIDLFPSLVTFTWFERRGQVFVFEWIVYRALVQSEVIKARLVQHELIQRSSLVHAQVTPRALQAFQSLIQTILQTEDQRSANFGQLLYKMEISISRMKIAKLIKCHK